MSGIQNLIESLVGHITYCANYNQYQHIVVYAASQNVKAVLQAVAGTSFKLQNNVEWPVHELTESNVQQITHDLISVLYFRYHIHVEIFQKPYPDPTGDYIDVDMKGAQKIYYDLTPCEQAIQHMLLSSSL